jgi:geranyl-CoA carboxylase beta subunit
MPALESKVDVNAEAFHRNAAEMQALIDSFRAIEARIAETSARAKPKFDARGQLLPRERIARLLDRGAPFLELATLAGYSMHDDDGEANVSGGGNICGIGQVSGIGAMVIANDAAIKGGASSPMGLKKRLRAQEIAFVNKLPTVYLVESAGANLLRQAELFVEGGRTFCNQARASAAGLPQVTVVHGSSTAGGAYLPGLSDYVVVVRKRAKIFLAGPPLRPARWRTTRHWAVPRCTPPSPARPNTWPRTTPRRSTSPARSWPSCRGTKAWRHCRRHPWRSRRATMRRSFWAWCQSTTPSPTTPAR